MTAEAITDNLEMLDERAEQEERVVLTLVPNDEELNSEAKAEKTPQEVSVNANQWSALESVYGSKCKYDIRRLLPDEAIGLLNQAARLYLRRLPASQRPGALQKLDILGDYTSGLHTKVVAAKHGVSVTTVTRAKAEMYNAMRRSLEAEVEAGRSIETPTSVVWSKLTTVQEKLANFVGRPGGDWQEQSLCHYLDPGLFDGTRKDKPSMNFAKFVCSQCTVQSECLTAATELTAILGVRGGLSGNKLKQKVRSLK